MLGSAATRQLDTASSRPISICASPAGQSVANRG